MGWIAMSQPIRILIADSDIDFVRNLQKYLDQQADMQVVDIVRDGLGAVNSCKESLPNLVLMDLHLPVLDSIKAIQRIVAHNERIRILTTSAISGDRYALEAVKIGASGYVEKNVDNEVILETIRRVASGDVSLNPALAASILEEFYRLAA
jgi:DNA-binding NarL/FixJ family response regulator